MLKDLVTENKMVILLNWEFQIFYDYVTDFDWTNQQELRVDFQLLVLDADNLAGVFW